MNIDYLKEYVELCKCLNFTMASEKLFITQPVLSRHITSLEDECGCKLLKRTKHSVSLTFNGELVFREAEKIIAIYDRMIDSISSARNGFSTKLRIGVMYYGAQKYISPIMKPFQDSHPSVQLQVSPGNPAFIIDNIMNNRLDAGIMERVNWMGSNRLRYVTIHREPLIAAINESHPLANHSSIHLSELKNIGLVNIKDYYYNAYTKKTMQMCRDHGFEMAECARVDSLEAVCLTIQNQGGCHIMPEHLKGMSFSNLRFIPIIDEDCYADICICYKPENESQALLQLIKMYQDETTFK